LPQRGAGAEIDSAGEIGERQTVWVVGHRSEQAKPTVGGPWCLGRGAGHGPVGGLRHVAQYGRLCHLMKDQPPDQEIELRGRGTTIDDVVAVARHGVPVRLGDDARRAMERSAELVDGFVAADRTVYGVTTGFGSLANTAIPPARTAELQIALVRSHATGMGPTVEPEVVRALLLLRARSLAMAHSGARPELVDAQLALLRHGLTPVVREHGSLGASGDLAPLSHCALALLGEGEVWNATGALVPTSAAMAAAGLEPITLRAKEGLALINGTDGILGMLCLALHDLHELLRLADLTAAMTVEGLLGTDRAFAADLQALRPQLGQAVSARNLTRLLAGSPIVASHREGDTRVQDAYSLRCTPQVHGAVHDTVAHARVIAERELDAAIDNPMILPDGRVESCGNFHGAPVALVCDFLAIAVSELCAISERRTDRMLDVARSHGLPPFLSPDAGVNSGLMIAHYTQAAMAMEAQRLAVPASTQSLPTSAMQEDHVSNGWAAARKLRRSVDTLRRVLAVEFVCAGAAIDLRAPLEPGAATGAALGVLRRLVTAPGPDRWLSPDLRAAEAALADGSALVAVESTIGPLEVL
jgi:histidine ammonia-lyase